MAEMDQTPLTFSEVLDVTFRIIKEYFSKLFLIVLIFVGPYYLLQGLSLISEGVSLVRGPNVSAGLLPFLESLTESGMQGANANFGITQTLLMFVAFLLLLIGTPVAYASIFIATEQIRQKEPVIISAIIKRAFSRFWALLGGSLVYGLVLTALFFCIALLMFVYIGVTSGLGIFTSLVAGSGAGLATIHILAITVLGLISLFGYVYLMTRWSFFFPAIVFEKVSPGLEKSWKLTRGCFWRIVGLFLVVGIINGIISGALKMATAFFLGSSVLAFLINSFVSILVLLTPTVAFAVIYFDLRVRNEAGDLRAIIETYHGDTEKTEQ